MIDPTLGKTFWLTLTNIGLGLATLSVLALIVYGLIRDLKARGRRQ